MPRPRTDTYPPFGAALQPPAAVTAAPVPATPAVPFTIHTRYPAPATVRPGYGLNPAASTTQQAPASSGSDMEITAVRTRLDRRVRARGRRRDDEFRQAGRAELFSDDARYSVVLATTAAWYAPVLVIFLLWVLAGGAATGAQVLSGLLWLAAAAALSMAVAALLRWAWIGWRALTLTIAAALIGGAVTAIAQTLSG